MAGGEGNSFWNKLTGAAEAPSDHDIAPRSETPSDHNIAPRSEAPSQGGSVPEATAGDIVGSSSSPRSDETVGKKKRGRPRKSGLDGSATRALSSSPPFSRRFGDSAGTSFRPYIIAVSAGQDVAVEILSFAQQGPRAICILSANGVVSDITLRQPNSSGVNMSYQGAFQILSMSGSFIPTENQGIRNRSGGITISFSSRNGHVVGGRVTGALIAVTPVQVVVGSFLPNQKDQKQNKPESDNPPANATPAIAGSSAPPPSNVESNSNPPSPIPDRPRNWYWVTDPKDLLTDNRKFRRPGR